MLDVSERVLCSFSTAASLDSWMKSCRTELSFSFHTDSCLISDHLKWTWSPSQATDLTLFLRKRNNSELWILWLPLHKTHTKTLLHNDHILYRSVLSWYLACAAVADWFVFEKIFNTVKLVFDWLLTIQRQEGKSKKSKLVRSASNRGKVSQLPYSAQLRSWIYPGHAICAILAVNHPQ